MRLAGVLLFGISAVLLTSIGGLGIFASPITLPLMYVTVWAHPTRAFRIAGVVIGGLTGLQAGWGLGILLFGYETAAVPATMIVAGLLTVVLFARAGNRPSQRAVAPTS